MTKRNRKIDPLMGIWRVLRVLKDSTNIHNIMRKKNYFLISTLFIAMVTYSEWVFYDAKRERVADSIRICFYNVENLFDPYDDPGKDDEIFTAGNIKGWNSARFRNKYVRIAKVILALGRDEPPEIIGLAEIENDLVLRRLVYETPLKQWNYQYIHQESMDRRGIDVALLYRKSCMHLDNVTFTSVRTGKDLTRPTRQILAVSMFVPGFDTLTFIVNHWPSRFGGKLESDKCRMKAAETLAGMLDSLARIRNRGVVVMGDFNDGPNDKSLLRLSGNFLHPNDSKILCIENITRDPDFYGTLKFGSVWYTFDQFLVSEDLVNNSNNCYIAGKKANIFHPDFLLCNDENFPGSKPFRTYYGSKYTGGFSDHLPIYIDILNQP